MMNEDIAKKAKQQAGALLPDVDPNIGEMVLQTLLANPDQHPAMMLVALVSQAPHPEVAIELASAMMELILCHEKGHNYWLQMRGHTILTGVRKATPKDGIMFGVAHWPMSALVVGPPKNVVIRLPGNQLRRVWMACENMEGVSIRQSEAIALGNAMVEQFGGRVLEDRQGPDVLRNAAIEQNFTKRAKLRAQAMSKLDAITIEAHDDPKLRPEHAHVALAEAVPGTLNPGQQLVPWVDHGDGEGLQPTDMVYEVERRVNESWVVLVCVDKDTSTPPAFWRLGTGAKVHPDAPEEWAGFTDEWAIARTVKPAEGEE